MNNIQKLVTIGMIQNHEGLYLVTQRYEPSIPAAHLKWDLPGGTVEYGESPYDTVIRELQEEVGIQVHIETMLPYIDSAVWDKSGQGIHAVVVCFVGRLVSGTAEPREPKVHLCRWVTMSEALELDCLPSLYKFFKIRQGSL